MHLPHITPLEGIGAQSGADKILEFLNEVFNQLDNVKIILAIMSTLDGKMESFIYRGRVGGKVLWVI